MSISTLSNIIENFATIGKIDGMPTYQTLDALRQELGTNAAKVTTRLGGGQHGYLGIVYPTTTYLTISGNETFTPPQRPNIHPTIEDGATQYQIAEVVRQHKANQREYDEWTTVNEKIKQQIINAVGAQYLRGILHKRAGASGLTAIAMLTHLFSNYIREPEIPIY